MKKLLFTVAILTTFDCMCYAQPPGQSRVDSLLANLNSIANSDDTVIINTLFEIADAYLQISNYDRTLIYASKALALTRQTLKKGEVINKTTKNRFILFEGKALREIGLTYYILGNKEQARLFCDSSYAVLIAINATYQIALTDRVVGDILSEYGTYNKKALEKYYNALAVFIEYQDKKMECELYSEIAGIYINEENDAEALKNLIRSFNLAQELNYQLYLDNASRYFGDIYLSQGNFEKAKEAYENCLRIATTLQRKHQIAFAHNNLGNVYTAMKQFPNAEREYRNALKIRMEIHDKYCTATSFNDLGLMYLYRNSFDTAFGFFQKAITLNEELKTEAILAQNYFNMGKLFIAQNKYENANKWISMAVVLSQKLGLKKLNAECYKYLANIFEQKGELKKSNQYYRKYFELTDSLRADQTKTNLTAELLRNDFDKKQSTAKAEQEQKDAVSAAKLQKQKVQKYSFIGGLILVAIIAFLFINRLRLRQVLKLQEIRNKIASDLHDDIGSTLSSIAIYSELANEEVKVKSDKASSLLQTINENSRSTIESMSDIVWAINPKNDRFENILQRMRAFASGILEAKNIDLVFPTSPALSALKLSMDKRKNLYLLFKEAVNNVAKYSACKNCSIQLGLKAKMMNMEIADDGIGFDMNDHPSGNGQINMKKRSEALNGTLVIQSGKGQGTTIHLSFPTT